MVPIPYIVLFTVSYIFRSINYLNLKFGPGHFHPFCERLCHASCCIGCVPFHWHGLLLIPVCITHQPTLYDLCNYVSILRLKLFHDNKMLPWCRRALTGRYWLRNISIFCHWRRILMPRVWLLSRNVIRLKNAFAFHQSNFTEMSSR